MQQSSVGIGSEHLPATRGIVHEWTHLIASGDELAHLAEAQGMHVLATQLALRWTTVRVVRGSEWVQGLGLYFAGPRRRRSC